MSQTVVHNFAQKINELIPEISVDTLVAMWDEILVDQESETPKVEALSTCKHVFLKGKQASIQCKIKVKDGAQYCSKHKK
jgi:carbamate kinase